jgi:Ankyrin repeats (many copies)
MPYEGYGSLDLPSGRCTDFKLALNLGRIPFIEEIIRRSAWGIDFDQLEAQLDAAYHEDPTSNVTSPRFYSGLRVRGKYRRDWAKATAPSQDSPFHCTKIPVGMLAAYYGNPPTIEWLFGNGPANAVDEFIKNHKSDKRVELLEKSGWREHLTDWFGLRCTPARDNAFHAAIIGGKPEGIESVFKTFVQQGVAPLTILQSKQRSPKHDSLLISARLPHAHLENIFERYVKYGGDPTVTDEYGYNILHILAFTKNDVDLRFCLRQLSPEQKNAMLTSRVARTLHTPIALAVRSHRLDIVEMFLEHGTAQLCLRDGDGNLPIHIASGNGLARITAALIEAYPSGLLIEDTSGSLPIEIAEQRCLISNTQTDPFVFVYKASIEAQSRQNWVHDRPELQAPKTFMDQTLDKQVLEKTDVKATLEVINKAMGGVAISERKLVSLIDVSDVVRRATKRLTDSKREYSPGDHFTSRDSLWQMKEDKENTED